MKIVAESAQYLLLLLQTRIRHNNPEEKSVELCLGQFVCTLLFNRILGGHHKKRVAHLSGNAVNCYLPFLHYFKKSRLCFGRCTVYFVYQYNIAENRPLAEGKIRSFHIKYGGAYHIGWHQIGRKLNTAEIGPDCLCQQLGRQGLCNARNTLK